MDKKILKKLLPPIFVDAIKHVTKSKKHNALQSSQSNTDVKKNTLYWEGNYNSWQEALINADGYDAPQILAKVREATIKVKNGEAIYERDSFIFDEIQYNWALLSCLFKIAMENDKQLNIVDFGGSLGSSYFQNKDFLASLKKITWNVVEQEHFVATGKKEIASEQLNFYDTIEQVLLTTDPKVLLLSGVIQNLENPSNWIDTFISYNFDYIIIDRTAFIDADQDRLTIQNVPESIYKASYPAWFFNEDNFKNKFFSKYNLVCNFDSFADGVTTLEGNERCYRRGFLFQKK